MQDAIFGGNEVEPKLTAQTVVIFPSINRQPSASHREIQPNRSTFRKLHGPRDHWVTGLLPGKRHGHAYPARPSYTSRVLNFQGDQISSA